jgi:hypothetical protein
MLRKYILNPFHPLKRKLRYQFFSYDSEQLNEEFYLKEFFRHFCNIFGC